MNPISLINCTYEKNLKEKVTDPGKCCKCGTCGAVCPKYKDWKRYNALLKGALKLKGHDSVYSDECKLCFDVCPIARQRSEEGLGNVISYWRAKANDDTILSQCQDGGACTAFLESLEGYNTVTVKERNGLPAPAYGGRPKESLGSKYYATSSLSVLPKKRDNIAFVGLPCQMLGIKLAQELGHLNEIGLRIGLFCTKNFMHECFYSKLDDMDIQRELIEKINIKKDLVVSLKDKKVRSVPLSHFEECVLDGCKHCLDFCAFYSDISFGSSGTEDGYTTVLTRTRLGDDLFNNAVQKDFITADKKVDMGDILRLQDRKRRENG